MPSPLFKQAEFMETTEDNDVLAAVDLGSNSFHMIIARLRDGHFQIMDRLREMVQLRAGLDKQNMLSEDAQERAIACLERFGERIRHLPAGKVRVVGTNTLRIAENSREFLRKARQALGHPIEIVTGEEEARLIYMASPDHWLSITVADWLWILVVAARNLLSVRLGRFTP